MSEMINKSGLKVAIKFLFSLFILTGLNITKAYAQPLDSPLYNHSKIQAVESMKNADVNKSVYPMNSVQSMCFSICGGTYCDTVCDTCTCVLHSVPIMSSSGEIMLILLLTSGSCWAIIKKKCR